ncbi:MAG: DUF883 domain-containing protein [Betaproteobacteria bacterium]|nr:DUF883 domain-containing protein [Betaproteobacteria bacterium]
MNTMFSARRGTVETQKDKLVKNLKDIVTDADDLLKAVSSSTAEEFATARAKMEAGLGEAMSRLEDARIAVTDKARELADDTQEYVKEHPWKILGVVAAGVVIGLLLSRR